MRAVLPSAIALAAAAGCAHVEQLSDGSRRITGVVQILIPSALAAGRSGGDSVEVRTLGMLFFSGPTASGLSLGYASERVTVLRNNAVVSIYEGENAQ